MTEADDPWANHIRGMVPTTPLEDGRDPLSLMSSAPPVQSTPTTKAKGTTQNRPVHPKDELESLEAKWGLDRSTEEGTVRGRRTFKGREILAQDRSPPPINDTPNSTIDRDRDEGEDKEDAFAYPTESLSSHTDENSIAKSNNAIIKPDDALASIMANFPPNKQQISTSSPQQLTNSLAMNGHSSDPGPSQSRDQSDFNTKKPIDYSRLNRLCSQGPLSSLQKYFEVVTSPSSAGSGISAFALANEPNPASGLVPIHLAAREGKVEILKWLITEAGAIVEMEDKEGETALHKAALLGKLPALSLLLSSGADSNARDGDGWTALHNACSRGYLDIVKVLIENAGADVDVKGGRGSWTPLMNASSHGHLPIVRYLISRQSADPFLRNAAGETAFDVAAATFEIYICELLEKYESDRWAALTLASTSTSRQMEGSSSSPSPVQSLNLSSSPYNPLALHTTVPVVLHENQRLDTRLSTLAIRGGRPRWSGTQAGRPDKIDRRAPSTMPPGSLSLSRSRNIPMRREDVKLPTREEPYKLKLANRSAQIAAVKRARGEINNEEYGSTPTPDSIMNRSRNDKIDAGNGQSTQKTIQGQSEGSSHFWLSEWQQDMTNPQVDAEQGWQYSQSFDTPEEKWLATPSAPLLRLLEGRGLGQNMQRAVTGAMLGSSDTPSMGGEAEAVSIGWVRRRRWVRVMKRRLDIQFGDELEAAEQAYSMMSTRSKQLNGRNTTLTSSSNFQAQQEARSDAEKLGSDADYVQRSQAMVGEALKSQSRGQEHLIVCIARLDLAVEELRSNTFKDDDPNRQSRAERLLKNCTVQLGHLRQEAGLEEGSDEEEEEDEEDAEFIYPNSYKDDGQSVITRIGTPSVTTSGIVPPRQRSAIGEIGASLGATRSADLASAIDFRVPTNEMPTRPALSTRPNLQEQILLPIWENDHDVGICRGCNRKFTFFLRKHHCRRCGRIHCDACSSHRAQLLPDEIVIDPSIPEMIITEVSGPTRICDTCDAERRLPSSLRNLYGMDALSNAVDQAGLQRDDSGISDVSSRASELNECPVCNVVLATLGHGTIQEEHVRECLENGGGGSVQVGRYLIYKLAEGPIVGKECQICLEDLCVGMTIARLPCLCYYHRHCIDSWFSRGRSCPVHARSW